MKATDFEFRRRALLISLIYCFGFWAYAIDHKNLALAIVDKAVGVHSPHAHLLVRLFFAFATLLVAFAAVIRTWGAAYLHANVVHDVKLHSGILVADGPFRYVRNPLYLGGIVSAFGIGLMASRLGAVVIVVGLTLLYLRLAGREEAELEKQHGDRFREYCRRVPRLWPSPAPRVPAGGAQPQWGQAFRGEAFMWGFALAIGVFTVTQNGRLMAIIYAAALLAFVWQQVIHNRRRAERLV
ncbi:MAG: isoprenylcysteine carboxylmethyltransferase family protein [Candidatus Acidiferrales bacterium]